MLIGHDIWVGVLNGASTTRELDTLYKDYKEHYSLLNKLLGTAQLTLDERERLERIFDKYYALLR